MYYSTRLVYKVKAELRKQTVYEGVREHLGGCRPTCRSPVTTECKFKRGVTALCPQVVYYVRNRLLYKLSSRITNVTAAT